MTKEKFIKLNIIDKVEYINTGLREGKNVSDIRKYIGISEKEFQKLMRDNNYKFNQKKKQYIPTTEATTETTTNYITIDLIDDKHLKPKPKSIRINEFIYQEWQEFCNKQHYSKMDLISMALKEYMEKYK